LEDTAVIFTSDHGDLLGDYGLFGKGGPWEQSYRVPLCVVIPGLEGETGREVHAPTESIDIAPTILDLLGCEIPKAFQGRSLLPFFQKEAPEWRTCVHWEHVSSEADHRLVAAKSKGFLAVRLGSDSTMVYAVGPESGQPSVEIDDLQDLPAEARELVEHVQVWGADRPMRC
jgi:arylsulfatase A-like enzyme